MRSRVKLTEEGSARAETSLGLAPHPSPECREPKRTTLRCGEHQGFKAGLRAAADNRGKPIDTCSFQAEHYAARRGRISVEGVK